MRISQWSVTTVFLAVFLTVGAEIWTSPKKLMARPRSEIKLSCGSDNPYRSCSWTLPSNSSCSNIRPGMTGQCREVQMVIFDASENYCNITVKSVRDFDNGAWTCELEYPDRVDTAFTELIVIEEASVNFENVSGTIFDLARNPVVLTCQARHGRPLGKFIWKQLNPDDTEEILEITQFTRVSLVGEPGSGFFDAEETLTFFLEPSDDGAKIICTYQQYGFQGDVIADNSIDIDLKVGFVEVNLQDGSPFNITAQIYGPPRPKVTWQISKGNDLKVNLTEENPQDEQHYLNQLVASDYNVYLSTLIINRLPVKDEDRKYKLFVESPNKALSVVEEVKLVTPEAVSSSVTISVISVICILILIIAIVLTLLYAKKNHKWCFHVPNPHISAEEKMQVEPLHDKGSSSIIKPHLLRT